MNCRNCNAVMRVDQERKVFVCPYCESIEPLDGVSAAELKGLLHDAIKDVRKESMQEARQAMQQQKALAKNRTSGQKTADAVIFVLQIWACIFLSVFSVAMFTEYTLTGIVSFVQLILLIVSMVMKHKWRMTGERKYFKVKNVCQIIAGVLIIAWIASLNIDGGSSSGSIGSIGKEEAWPTQGFGSDLPKPEGKIKYAFSDKTGFNATITGVSQTGFDDYVKACKEKGYNVDEEVTSNKYEAYDADDNKLTVDFYDGRLSVDIDKAIVWDVTRWPESEIAKVVPAPKAEKYSIQRISSNDLEIYAGELTKDQFVEYVLACQNAGYDGTYDSSRDYFYGRKDDISLRLEFKRGKLLYVDVYLLTK